MDDNVVKNFFEYLENIGLIDNMNKRNLFNVYCNIFQNSNDKNFSTVMFETLLYFFNNFDEEQKKFSSLNLIIKYFSNQKENKIPENNYIQKESKSQSMKQLIQSNNNNKIKPNKNNQNNSSSNLRNKNSLKRNNKSNNLTNSNLLLETSWDKKEREEFEKCTFEPEINKRINTAINPNVPIYERLYSYNKIYKQNKELKINEKEKKENEQNSFKPKILTPEKYKTKNNFEHRQKLYLNNKNKHHAKLVGQIEKNFNKNCSFSPKINSKKIDVLNINNKNNETPVHLRLYEDVQKRKNKNLNLMNNLKTNEQSNVIDKENPLVDYEKIEELYNQYKNKPLILQKMKEKFDNEEGITFQPFIIKNYLYDKVKSDFYQRNKKMIENKEKFINECNLKKEENFKKNQLYSDKRYTQNEKDEITKRIVDRLYGNNILKKDKENNFKEDDKYCDKIISLDEYHEGKNKKIVKNNIPYDDNNSF